MDENETLPSSKSSSCSRVIYEYEKSIFVDGEEVAVVSASYEVGYFENNKIHLYIRSLSRHVVHGYDSSYIHYGTIINTDGSISYTAGDKFILIGNDINTDISLDFIVTPNNTIFN